MKIVIGNIVFAGIVLALYYSGVGGRQDFLRSVVFVLLSFLAGTIVGYWLSRQPAPVPRPPRRVVRQRTARAALAPSPFDHIVE